MLKLMILLCVLFVASCNPEKSEHAPMVSPVIEAISNNSVSIKWENAGEAYSYSVLLSSDTINDSDFRGIDTMYENLSDTFYTISGLVSSTYYKIKVVTFGGEKAPRESWPPLRFKTE